MTEKSEINEAIVNNLQVDEEGYKEVKTLDIAKLMSLGVVDVPAFLQGLLDAENDQDFNESSTDYVKGYKYGKTNEF